MRVDIADGKYTYVLDELSSPHMLRNGEPWDRDVLGDKLVYCMASEIDELRAQLSKAERDKALWKTMYKIVLEHERRSTMELQELTEARNSLQDLTIGKPRGEY